MSMTSAQVVDAAIHFRTPDRLPVMMDAFGVSDVFGLRVALDSERERTGVGLDEYGCRWSKTQVVNMGQVTGHPLTDLSQVATWPLPDFCVESRIPALDASLRPQEAAGKYITTGHFMLLFERMQALCGFSEVLTGLYEERPAMEALADRLIEVVLRKIEFMGRHFGKRIHGFTFTEDWGTQEDLMISPQAWRDFFKPRYRRLFDAMHAQGWDVWMHSCGKVNRIIGDLIEVGCNVVNLQQPRALGIEEVGKAHAGKITFQTACDIQATLPYGTDAEVARDVDDLLKYWATPQGGFILSDYGDGDAIGVTLERKKLMYDLFMEKDPYRRRYT
jgi:uroporphyrinogen decarboxylase